MPQRRAAEHKPPRPRAHPAEDAGGARKLAVGNRPRRVDPRGCHWDRVEDSHQLRPPLQVAERPGDVDKRRPAEGHPEDQLGPVNGQLRGRLSRLASPTLRQGHDRQRTARVREDLCVLRPHGDCDGLLGLGGRTGDVVASKMDRGA